MYLLDTHALIWFLTDSPELSVAARNTICSNTDIFVSYASLWEMSIKKSLGKLVFPYTFEQLTSVCKEESIQLLGMNYADLDIVEKLPFIHRDPFDRLLIAQAKSRNITIITRDNIIPRYDVSTLW